MENQKEKQEKSEIYLHILFYLAKTAPNKYMKEKYITDIRNMYYYKPQSIIEKFEEKIKKLNIHSNL